MNPNSHIPYLQAQLAFAWHNRLVLDRRLFESSLVFLFILAEDSLESSSLIFSEKQ